jgi:hypothetical protein
MKARTIYATGVLAIAILSGAATTASAQAVDAWDKTIAQGARRFVVLRDFNS